MDSTIVIKVKYEKTLRRFNASVVDGRLALDMEGLRAKILHLFNLATDADLTLRYTDEDGDVVTLADEEDLVDVVKQSLNPLRITIKLNSEKSVKKHSSGSSTPTVSPQTQHSLNEFLKSVPAPNREAASKLSKHLPLKLNISPQGLSKLSKGSSKLEVGPSSNSNSGVAKLRERLQKAGLFDTKGSNLEVGPSANSFFELNRLQKAGLLDTKGSNLELCPSAISYYELTKNGDMLLKPGLLDSKGSNLEVGASANSKSGVTNLRDQLQKAGLVVLPPPLDLNAKSPEGHCTGMPNAPSDKYKENKSNQYPFGGMSECPFSGTFVGYDSGFPLPTQYAPQWAPPIGSLSPSPHLYLHMGVECDGCGAHPIAGMRFKSIVKDDYDLCSTCFAKEGNAGDYIKIDRPVPVNPRLRPLHLSTGAGTKGGHAKMDSCFIQDVNILDGTIMSPSTPFTKIWRMKNNGTIVWPHGTHLMWTGGDRFSNTDYVKLEIPKDGLPVGVELDVAIDFCAPALPGRYISYWRMALPSGQKFGQRIWALIQVDASLTNPERPRNPWLQNTHSFNLNLPPTNSINAPQIVNVNVDEPTVKNNSPAEPERANKDTELVEPLLEAYTKKDQELNFPINDTLLVGGGASKVRNSPVEASSSTVSYPVVDLSKVEPIEHYKSPAATNLPVPATLTTTPAQLEDGKNEVEQKLLRELEEMGFKQTDLNKEILRKNEYNLQQSVDDLCGVEEWDPILDELKEMGFCNDEVNKRLLKKNNGSIKRVVMDLINGE